MDISAIRSFFFNSFNCSVIKLVCNIDNYEKSNVDDYIKPWDSASIILKCVKALSNIAQNNLKC